MAEEKKKPLTLRRMVEEVIEFEKELTIENVEIGGKKYELKISNLGGRLVLDFNNRDYEIVIDEDGIRFERYVCRPSHDHDDYETFQEGVDESKIGVKKGELIWRVRPPYNEGYKYHQVPFGSTKVQW